jgi:predicted nucleic acid-binding protein
VQTWALAVPSWVRVVAPAQVDLNVDLGAGEREAIALAHELGALLLIDERKGKETAAEIGIRTAGTLAVLEEAATLGLVDFEQMIERLRATNFRVRNTVLDASLARMRTRKN